MAELNVRFVSEGWKNLKIKKTLDWLCARFSHLRRPFLQKAQFSANSAGPSAPVICGTNTGYHMILEVFFMSQCWSASKQLQCNHWSGPGWLQHIIFHVDFSFPSSVEHSNYAGGQILLLSCLCIFNVNIFSPGCVISISIHIFSLLWNFALRSPARLPGAQQLVAFSGSQVLFKLWTKVFSFQTSEFWFSKQWAKLCFSNY